VTEETLTTVATPATDAKTNGKLPATALRERPAAEPDPLAKRFLNIRTLLSFAIGLGILAFVLSRMDVNVAEIRAKIVQTSLPLFVAALVLYYLTFFVRALRWQQLLANVGYANDDSDGYLVMAGSSGCRPSSASPRS
jgi:pilus assembly protein TadC